MEHFELHTLTDQGDVAMAVNLGLMSETDADDALYCEHCDERVGEDFVDFYPFSVVLSDDDYWFLCEDCSAPMTNPADE